MNLYGQHYTTMTKQYDHKFDILTFSMIVVG
jgi:hypothetical protein